MAPHFLVPFPPLSRNWDHNDDCYWSVLNYRTQCGLFVPAGGSSGQFWAIWADGVIVVRYVYTSLRCRWQTRATQCLRPTVWYPDVDGQCDKLVTDTVTSLLHWPSTLVDSTWGEQPFQRYGWCQPKFKWFTPLSGMVCHPWASTFSTVNLPTKFEVCISTERRCEKRCKMSK